MEGGGSSLWSGAQECPGRGFGNLPERLTAWGQALRPGPAGVSAGTGRELRDRPSREGGGGWLAVRVEPSHQKGPETNIPQMKQQRMAPGLRPRRPRGATPGMQGDL